MNHKLTDKDKKDWKKFTSSKDKIYNKDFIKKNRFFEKNIKKIDLHGLSLANANQAIEKFIYECFKGGVSKIIVITGKGLRSKNMSNPFVSKDLSILKYSVPNFIKSNKILMKMIINTENAKIEDGGSGAFYIFLKKDK